ncbi:20670_t:CDS:2, partial [Racocetra persica]
VRKNKSIITKLESKNAELKAKQILKSKQCEEINTSLSKEAISEVLSSSS